jgi:outer membrane protein insertion porin family
MRSSLKSVLCGLVLGILVASGMAGAARAETPGGAAPDLELEGARTITAEEIRAHLGSMPQSASDARWIDEAITKLMGTGIFADVHIEPRGGKLLVKVVENPIIAAVSFEGNSAIEKKKLEDTAKLKAKARYSQARANADARSIKELYLRAGRLTTTVEPRVSKLADDRVNLAFVVKEGAVSKIDHIGFTGNRAFSESQLRDVITTSESGWFDIFKTAAFYDAERTETDRDLLRRYYANNGYPDARIGEVAATLNATQTGYTLTFPVDEGPRVAFAQPTIEAEVAGVDSASLLGMAKVTAGKPYSQEQVDKSVEAIGEKLADNGQLFVRVRARSQPSASAGQAVVVFRVEKAPPLYVERIDIEGNTRTKDFVIRRELKLAEGDPVNAFLIERAVRRLKALGLFKSVDVKHVPGVSAERVRLTFVVVEEETGNLSFGGGYSTTEGIVGDISWTERNLLGNGQYLRLKLAGSLVRLQADIGFTEPRFLGTNVAAGFDLFYKDVDYTKQASYKSTKVGGDLRLGFPMTDKLTSGVNYTFVRNTLHDVGPDASAAIREQLAQAATYNTSSVGSSLTYDGRDSKKRPTEGVYYTIAQDLAGVGGDVRFVRSTGDFKAYYPVSESVTFMGRVTGGIINGWGGQDVRLLDLFYKGGDMVRGFATAGIGPRDTLSANQDALGGRMYVSTTAETLFDIPGVPKDMGVRGAVFADAGSLWGTNSTAAALPGLQGDKPAFRASAGVGLIWDSPIGGLRADYAFPLVKQPFDKLQPFSFGIAGF